MDFSFLSELFKHRHWALAALGAGCTILYLNDIGVLGSVSNDDTWIPMIVILAGWFVLLGMIEKLWQFAKAWWILRLQKNRAREDHAQGVCAQQQQQQQHLNRMNGLTDSQKNTLAYIKHRGNRQFQAYILDEDITALHNTQYIRVLAGVGGANAMYEIPVYVWDAIVVTDEGRALNNAPWEIRKRRSARLNRI